MDRIHHNTRRVLHKRADNLLQSLDVKERVLRVGMRRWIETNLRIRPQHGGIEPFVLRPFQRYLVAIVVMMERFQIPIRIIILKSRKEGCSTVARAICFHRTIKTEHNESILIAHDVKTSKKLFDIDLKFYSYLPEEEKLPLRGRESQKSLAFAPPHYSEIVPYTAGDPNVARGMTPRDIHFSEQAFWPFDQATWTAAESAIPGPTKSRDTMIISESTACGMGGTFHELWEQSFKPQSWFELYKFLRKIRDNWEQEPIAPWIGLFTSWADDPECQIPWNEDDEGLDPIEYEYKQSYGLSMDQVKWARHTRKNRLLGSWEKFHQEYPCSPDLAFKFSGFPLFDGDVLREQLKRAKERAPVYQGNIRFADSFTPKAELTEDVYGPLLIWEHPKPGVRYAVGMDVSEGIGSDFTEIIVFSVGTYNQVAHFYHNRMSLTEVSVIAYLLGCYYNWALLGVERNSIGQVVLEILRYGSTEHPQMGEYPNIYHHVAKDRQTQEIQRRPGFQTSSSTKQRALTLLQDAICHNRVTFRGERLINQLAGFGIDPKASGNRKFTQRHKDPESLLYSDDSVMACAIAATMREEVLLSENETVTMTVW